MDVAGLTQWGTSWPMERVCGRGGPDKNHRDAKTADSRELWKSVEKSKALGAKPAPGGQPGVSLFNSALRHGQDFGRFYKTLA